MDLPELNESLEDEESNERLDGLDRVNQDLDEDLDDGKCLRRLCTKYIPYSSGRGIRRGQSKQEVKKMTRIMV